MRLKPRPFKFGGGWTLEKLTVEMTVPRLSVANGIGHLGGLHHEYPLGNPSPVTMDCRPDFGLQEVDFGVVDGLLLKYRLLVTYL